MIPVTTTELGMRTADQESQIHGITRYLIRLTNGDLVVATFEEFTFDIEGGEITHTGQWKEAA